MFMLLCQLVSSHASLPWKWFKSKRHHTFPEQNRRTSSNNSQEDEPFLHMQSNMDDTSQRLVRSKTYAVTAVATTAVQWGLIIFLARSVWKAVKDILEEIASMDDSEADVPLIRNPREVDVDAIDEKSLTHGVASKLMKSGMPLRSSTERSVESVLQSLTKSEASLLNQCMYVPSSHPKIAGFADIQKELQSMLNRFLHRDESAKQNQYASLFDDDKSHHVLLYGPPGMGKSLLIKRLACQIPTVLITPSVLLRKYVGETNTRIRTLFTALHKIAPVLLCLDEVDGLFRERQAQEHEVNRDLKTEFLQWWDGLLSGEKIWIVAATNRPFEVDSAVLRRLPRQYYIGPPDVGAREEMLHNLLENLPHGVDLHHVAHLTHGYTASDLRRLLQTAAAGCGGQGDEYDMMSTEHVLRALETIKPTPQTPAYIAALQKYLCPREEQSNQPYFQDHQIVIDPLFWGHFSESNQDVDVSDADTDDF